MRPSHPKSNHLSICFLPIQRLSTNAICAMGTDTHSGSWTSIADDNPQRPTTCRLEQSPWWSSFPLAWSTLPGFLPLCIQLWSLIQGSVWRLLNAILCHGWMIWTSGGRWIGLTSTGIASLAVECCWVLTSIGELYSPVQHHRMGEEKEKEKHAPTSLP